MADRERAALEAIDGDALARDASALVAVPSPTGEERAAVERFAELAGALGLTVEVHDHELGTLRAHPGHPGEEAPRSELVGATATLPGDPARRFCLNGHLDTVGPGAEPWGRDPFSGALADGWLHGRGAVDMKGPLVAALHAVAALRGRVDAEIVIQAVPSEEDGGQGTFAALELDARFDACLIPEPTGFAVVCAQAGALTFAGEVRGRAAHAAVRREGVSAIDRYLPVHAALAEHERRLNADVAHPLMRELPLPYPVSVGRLEAGEWSSSVPARLRFEGRLGVRVGETPAEARAALQAAVLAASDCDGPPPELRWTGGQFAAGETAADHPFVGQVRDALAAELGREPFLAGVPYGADMRLFCERGIPCVMAGPPGLELAHAVDERVRVDDLMRLSRALARLIVRWGGSAMGRLGLEPSSAD